MRDTPIRVINNGGIMKLPLLGIEIRRIVSQPKSKEVKYRKAQCKYGHPLDLENVVVFANGHRRCRTCYLAYNEKYAATMRAKRAEAKAGKK